MPRYHFNFDDDADIEGHELDSLADAKCVAIKTFASVICDQGHTFWDNAEWTMTVTDGGSLTLFQLHIVGMDSAAIISEDRASA